MPNDPERNIEKTLKAYAKQRRDAGAPREMHPATRKLLLEEAARVYPASAQSKSTRSWWQWLWGSWPRLAMNVGLVVALIALAIFLMPTKPGQKAATLALAMNRDLNKSREVRAPVAPVSAPVAKDKMSAYKNADSSLGLNPSGSREASTVAIGSNGGEDKPSGSIPATIGFQPADRIIGRQFAQVKTKSAGKPESVLKQFQVEWVENKLRVIDNDGSVYEGTQLMAQTSTAGEARRSRQKETMELPALTGANKKNLVTNTVNGEPLAKPQFFYFSVSGTNISLNKKIVFNGHFEGQPTATNRGSPWEWADCQVSGRAMIGSNQWDVLAKPVGQK